MFTDACKKYGKWTCSWLPVILPQNLRIFFCSVLSYFFRELKIKYNITAVPKLIIVHRNGDVITSKGRKEVKDKGVICFRNWQQTAGVLESRLSQATDTGAKKEAADTEQNEEKKKDAEQ